MTSQSFRTGLFDENSDELPVVLLTVAHPMLTTEIMLSSDNADILDHDEQLRGTISRGRHYSFLPMEITLPEQGDRVLPILQVMIQHVASEITPLLEATATPALVTVDVVAASAPDDLEMSYAIFELTEAVLTGDTASLSLTIDDLSAEPYPADNFTPSSFPGLWAAY